MNLQTHGDVDPDGIRTLQTLIADEVLRSAVYYHAAGSTNSLALDDLRATHEPSIDSEIQTPQPRLYLADVQSAGRGRLGRTWISDVRNLAFSLSLEQSLEHSSHAGLSSIATGVAIAEAIEHEFAPLKTQLKWPNDLWIQGRKCVGILIEKVSTSPETIVIGVGINVGAAPSRTELRTDCEMQAGSEAQTRGDAICLAEALGRPIGKWQVLDAVIRRMTEVHNSIKEFSDLSVDSFRQRCVLTGQAITFCQQGHQQSGLCAGITNSGALLVKLADRELELTSGEASLVRVQPNPRLP